MNYKELECVAENWYQRLNRLKAKYGEPATGITDKRAEKIIFELIQRIMAITSIMIQIQQPMPDYPSGGYSAK